jgi:tRNA-modifying protein YgfZ
VTPTPAVPSPTADLGLLEREAVMTPDSGRELIVATGADRSRFLHGIVTGNVAGTAAGHGARSVLLTPKGHIVADMRLFVRADAIWIVVDAGQARGVAEALSRYAIMDDFAAAPQEDFSTLSLLGPKAGERLRSVGIEIDPGVHTTGELSHADVRFAEGTLWVVCARELGADGFWLGGPRALVEAARARLSAAGTPELTPAAAEAARIAALEPRFGAEITADYFPMEVGLEGAIDYTKGCYLGQEPIVRIRDRGHINWRVVRLDLAGPADVAPNDRLETDAKPKAGRITSAARLPEGQGVALAMLHMSVPVGATVRIQHGDDRIEATVRAESAPRPRES